MIVDFSSSSDDELERELIRQRRKEEREEHHIVRAASAHSPPTPHVVVLPGQRKVEVRKGSIYIPIRDMYVHTIEAKRHPSWYFGDGSLRRHRRPPVAPESVLLYAVRGSYKSEQLLAARGESATGTSPLVSLREASNADFLVFKGITHSAPRGQCIDEEDLCAITSDGGNSDSSANIHTDAHHFNHWPQASHAEEEETLEGAGEMKEAAHALAPSYQGKTRPTGAAFTTLDAIRAPFASVRVHYDVTPGLSVACTQSWATENRRVPVHAQYATFTRENCDQVFFYNGLARSVGRFWCEPEDDVLHTEAVQQLNGVVAQKDLIGVEAFESGDVVGYTLAGKHFVTSVLQSVSASSGRPESQPELHIYKGAPATGSPYECWCPYGHISLPALAVSAENDIFECTMSPIDGSWERHRLRRFVNTPPTALCTVGWQATGTNQGPAALLSGMRNGTIQMTALQGASRRTTGGFFDSTPRHTSASVVAMHALPDRGFEVVTVASTGEAKLWDVRYLTNAREPVLTLCPPRVDFGAVAGFCGHFVAIATRTASLVCVDASTGTVLADIQEDIPLDTARCCVVRADSDYQVYLLKERRVHRIVLSSA